MPFRVTLQTGANPFNGLLDRRSAGNFKSKVPGDGIHSGRIERNAAAINGLDEYPGPSNLGGDVALEQSQPNPGEHGDFV